MDKATAIFTFAIDAIGADKVAELLQKLGYTGEPTAELCKQVLDEKGKAFAAPFGKLMKKAANNPSTKATLLAAAKIAKASGEKTSNMTAEEKSEMGLQWFNSLAGLFGTVINSVDDIANATNGTNTNAALYQLEREQRLREEANQKTTLYWILGGVGILLVIVIFAIALPKRN